MHPDSANPSAPPQRRDPVGAAAFCADAAVFSEWIAGYLCGNHDALPVLAQGRPGEISARLSAELPAAGCSTTQLLDEFVETLLPGLTHWNHPRFFAYFPSSAGAPGVLGEFLTAAVNQQAMLWRSSPAATELEGRALDWLRALIGLPPEYAGVAYDGGSMATLHGLLAARQAAIDSVRENGVDGAMGAPRYRLYASTEAHSSLDKAAIVLGLGQRALCRIAVDAEGRLDTAHLAQAIDRDRAAGLVPIAVIATAGTTGIGAVDPLDEIATLCASRGIWLHVDAAWAGAAALLPECAERFCGMQRADSVVVDPHKWLFTPIDLGICFFRRLSPLTDALALRPNYLAHADAESSWNLMDRGIALGRRWRGLKLWFVLRHYGADGLRRLLREHVQMARSFADAVDRHPHLERVAPIGFSLVCFRAVPVGIPAERLDAFNRRLLEWINAQGVVFLSATQWNGMFVLRLVVGHLRTAPSDLIEAMRQVELGIEAGMVAEAQP